MKDRDYEEIGIGRTGSPSGGIDVVRVGLADSAMGGGGIYFTPRAFKRLSSEGREAVSGLQQIAASISEAQEHLEEHVEWARQAGASWDLIGWSVGTTGEAARQRWGAVRHEREDA